MNLWDQTAVATIATRHSVIRKLWMRTQSLPNWNTAFGWRGKTDKHPLKRNYLIPSTCSPFNFCAIIKTEKRIHDQSFFETPKSKFLRHHKLSIFRETLSWPESRRIISWPPPPSSAFHKASSTPVNGWIMIKRKYVIVKIKIRHSLSIMKPLFANTEKSSEKWFPSSSSFICSFQSQLFVNWQPPSRNNFRSFSYPYNLL